MGDLLLLTNKGEGKQENQSFIDILQNVVLKTSKN